ncbi:uncharacterized protein [Anabrus simplex]|uniref:uncharacterized protein n=1 Tax=Anabrus simplex TaxID=316456 RepID=UPI0034DDB8B1
MADELLLPATLQKLEIGSHRKISSQVLRNPFGGEKSSPVEETTLWTSLSLTGEECTSASCKCNVRRSGTVQRSRWMAAGHVKKHVLHRSKLNFLNPMCSANILKDPVLKLTNFTSKKITPFRFGAANSPQCPLTETKESSLPANEARFGQGVASPDFKSLIQMPLSSRVVSETKYESESFRQLRVKLAKTRLAGSQSCSQQARMTVGPSSSCDDVTIDELASYFDLFVHIPKKMSRMAEMMYI